MRDVPIDVRITLQDLVHEFAYRVDFGPTDTVADLFAEDGWYGWGDQRAVGREAIRDTYRRREARGVRTARHLCANLRISMISDDHAQAQSVWLIFADDGPPPHPPTPLLVADVNDFFVRQGGQWLFQSRQLTDVFASPDRKPVLPLKA